MDRQGPVILQYEQPNNAYQACQAATPEKRKPNLYNECI